MLEYDIQQDDVPTVYEIGVGLNPTKLVIKIHPQVQDHLFNHLSPDNRLISLYQQELDLPDYVPPGDEWIGWGFGPVLSRVKNNNWLTYGCQLPGVFKNEDDEEGSWRARYSVSATLTMLFKALDMNKVTTNANSSQLLHSGLEIKKGMHGGSIHVTIGRSLIPWLTLTQKISVIVRLKG